MNDFILIADENPYKHDQVECCECGKAHRTTKYIYKQTFGVNDEGNFTFHQELKCNSCKNKDWWIFRDRRAIKILDEYMKRTDLSERDRILYAMREFRSLPI
jgi:hypothetical protein